MLKLLSFGVITYVCFTSGALALDRVVVPSVKWPAYDQRVKAQMMSGKHINITGQGPMNVDEINTWVNNNVTYVPEPKGQNEWLTPRDMLKPSATTIKMEGDCEDFALLKIFLIEEVYKIKPLYSSTLVVVRDKELMNYHVVARLNDGRILDQQDTKVRTSLDEDRYEYMGELSHPHFNDKQRLNTYNTKEGDY